jgi:hypothetical protein
VSGGSLTEWSLGSSFPRKRESMLRPSRSKWIPAFAGMTIRMSIIRRKEFVRSASIAGQDDPDPAQG